ncbi:Rap1a/Tai family immunity protein [Acetobacteraceae bacterium ESL0709]|nr:Rap1a/Tai family immunity protein [Acetobacteraceae bacterium ESL0697]MDF7677938.1 Rap1a/Tai family immunity protein [Acetobacteraceae bacterium ESL0709]
MKFASALMMGALAFGALSVSAVPAHAQRVSKVTGKSLGQMCTNQKALKLCDAYLAGVMDSEVWSRDYAVYQHDKAPVAFCVAPATTTDQVRTAVVSWLKGHADSLSQPAGKAVYLALHESYPCGDKVNSSSPAKEGSSQ